MAYTALYRKWRPARFEDVRGQEHIVRTLKNQIISDRVGHAYLFCGTRGTGKTTIAKIMARAVNCEHPVDGSPCNECAVCRSILEGRSVNVAEIDAASNNGVDNIREIRDQVQYSPTEGKYRVYIIDEVHMLSAGAFNALLKTLEEPPAHAVFLLLAERAEAFLPTILSRVVVMKIRPLSAETIADYLMQAGHLAEESHILSAYAQGRIGQALELVEDEGFREMRQDILGKLEALPSMSEGDAYLLAKDLEGYKNDLRFLDIMELWYRDLLTAKSLREEGYLIQRDKKDAIFRAAKEPAALLAKKAAAVRTARMRLAQNANFRLTMEVMLMDLKETGK